MSPGLMYGEMHFVLARLGSLDGGRRCVVPSLSFETDSQIVAAGSPKIVSSLPNLKLILSGQPSMGEVHLGDHSVPISGVECSIPSLERCSRLLNGIGQ